jgi:hypothetical protein
MNFLNCLKQRDWKFDEHVILAENSCIFSLFCEVEDDATACHGQNEYVRSGRYAQGEALIAGTTLAAET